MRALFVSVTVAVAAVALAPRAEAVPSSPEWIDVGLAFAVPRTDDGERVVTDAWVQARIAEANRVWAGAHVRFRWTIDDELPASQREAHTRDDRDAYASRVVPGHVRVVLVTELEDVDEPGRRRMGVCWTSRKDKRRYIVLATSSFPSVLAHELGHYLGNPHSEVPDNLMSYTRTGARAPFVDDVQIARARRTAQRLLDAGVLVDVGPPRRLY